MKKKSGGSAGSREINKPPDELYKDAVDIINRSPAVAFLWKNEKNWPVEYVSSNVNDIFGYSTEDFTSGKILYSGVIHPDDLKRVAGEVRKYSLRKNLDFIHEPYRIIDKDKNIKWISDRTHIKKNSKGKITHYQGIVEDITKKIETEEALRVQNDITSALSSTSNYKKILPKVLYHLLQIREIDSGAIYLIDNKTGQLNIECHTGLSKEFIKTTSTYKGDSPQARLVMAGKAIYTSYDRLSFSKNRIRQKEGILTLAVIPIKNNTRIIGALNLASRSCGEIGKNSREIIEYSALRLGNIITRLMAEDEIKSKNKELNSAMARLKSINKKFEQINSRLTEYADELRMSEEKFATAFNNNPNMMAIVTPDEGRYVEVNEQFLNTLGYSREEITGKTPADLNIFADRNQSGSAVRLLAEQGWLKNVEIDVRTKNGEIRHGLTFADTFRIRNNKYILTVMTDITERKLAEEALKQSEDKFFNSFHLNPTPCAITRATDRIMIEVNDAIINMTGYSRDEFIGHTADQLKIWVEPEQRERLYELYYAGGSSVNNIECSFQTKDGKPGRGRYSAVIIKIAGIDHILSILLDDTERNRMENALIESEARFKALIENSTDMISIISSEGKVIYDSPSVERTLGYKLEETLNVNPLVYIHPEDLPVLFNKIFSEIAAPDSVTKNEHRVRHKDGSWRTVELIANNLILNPAVKGIVIVSRDITERKQAERMLQESEIRFRTLIENSADMLTILNDVGKIIYESPSVERILGYKPDETTNRGPFDIVHPDDLPEISNIIMREMVYDDAVVTFENRVRHKDGSWRLIEVMAKNLLLNPAIKGIVINSRDITKRRMAEEELRIRDTGIASSINGVAIADLEGKLTYVNNSILELWHHSREEMIGFHVTGFFDDPESIHEVINSLQTSGKWMGELKGKRSDGTLFDVQLSSNMVFNEKNQPVCMMGFLLDITKRITIEKELEKYREHLEELVADRTSRLEKAQGELVKKEKFATLGKITATVSHELRNPLATIRASIFSIRERAKDKVPGIDNTLDRAERNIDRCDKIIEDLLSYTRYKELELISTAIDKWLAQELSEYKMPSDIKFTREFHSGLKIKIDREKLLRSVINIIDNAKQAIEYNSYQDDSGTAHMKHVSVRTYVSGSRLEIQIEDTGPGMPPDALDKIFEGLYSTKATGIGLGLPFVKQIIEQHGGGIEVKSELKKGTTVTLWLPLEKNEPGNI